MDVVPDTRFNRLQAGLLAHSSNAAITFPADLGGLASGIDSCSLHTVAGTAAVLAVAAYRHSLLIRMEPEIESRSVINRSTLFNCCISSSYTNLKTR